MKLIKIVELIFGSLILLIGLGEAIYLIEIFNIQGFDSAYTLSSGFKPAWIYSLGFVVGGITLIWDSFNKKSKFKLELGKNKKRK